MRFKAGLAKALEDSELYARTFSRAAWIIVVTVAASACFSASVADENTLKADAVVSLIKFVDWPQSANSARFTVCIVGGNPFGFSVIQASKGRTVRGEPIDVHKLKDPAEGRQCRVMFIQRSENAKAGKYLNAVRGAPVLTVGEESEFGTQGGIVVLLMRDSRVLIHINPAIAERAGLRVSAKLLSLATIVKSEQNAEK